jgi:ferredoxin
MADRRKRLPHNAEGLFYVDSSCINCGVSRHYAPEVFGDDGDHAFVVRQPATAEARRRAEMALLACPVASIGTTDPVERAHARRFRTRSRPASTSTVSTRRSRSARTAISSAPRPATGSSTLPAIPGISSSASSGPAGCAGSS